MPISVCIEHHDDWDAWEGMVPEPIRRQFPQLIETIDFLDEHPTSREAALSLFWRIYDLSKKELPPSHEILGRIDDLERKLDKEVQDYDKDSSKIFVYLHVAGALITMLERLETYRSERFTETLEQIERLWKYGYYRKMWDVTEDDPLCKSLYALVSYISVRLFELKDWNSEWEEALADLVSAVRASEISGFGDPLDDLNPQAAVNTFEKLWDNQHKLEIESWKDLLGYCRELAWNETLLNVGLWEKIVNWKGEEQDFHTFWIYAEGLCKSRCSPSELMELRELEEKQSSERRLRNYFFYNCWDSLPEPLRDELKSIDRLWFSQEKVNLGGILDSLKIVTEGLVSQILWKPFIKWTKSTREEAQREKLLKQLLSSHYDDYKKQKHQPTLPAFAAMLEHNTFREFNGPELCLQDGSKFDLNELAQWLRELNRERNRRAHPKAAKAWQRQDVAPLLKKFFGIDCPGVLPFLARMLKETSTGMGTNQDGDEASR